MNDYQVICMKKRILCQKDLFTHVQFGMGYEYVPNDMREPCEWLQSKWNPQEPRRQNVLMQLMRDSYKSTCITQSYPSWALSLNPNLAILIASKVAGNAQAFHDVQRKRWETQDFKEIFGQWRKYNGKWDSEKVVIKPRNVFRKEASMTCAGTSTSLTSQHYDIIILDDITGPEDMYSQAERENSWRFYKSMFDLLDKQRGLLIVVGTCWHENDVLERIKKQQKEKIKKGVMPFETYYRPAYDENDNPRKYFFSWLSDKMINQIREDKADIRDFAANYLLKPIPDKFKIFHLDKLYYYDAKDMKRPEFLLMFIDPSLKDTKKSDYAAIIIVAVIKGKIYVLPPDIEQRKPSVTIKAIGDNFQRLQKTYGEDMEIFCYMETVMFQEFMKDAAVNELCNEGIYVPIRSYDQKSNKIARITASEKYLSSGIVTFRKDWENYEGYKILMQQLSNFPLDEHDDGPDALEGAITICMQMV